MKVQPVNNPFYITLENSKGRYSVEIDDSEFLNLIKTISQFLDQNNIKNRIFIEEFN